MREKQQAAIARDVCCCSYPLPDKKSCGLIINPSLPAGASPLLRGWRQSGPARPRGCAPLRPAAPYLTRHHVSAGVMRRGADTVTPGSAAHCREDELLGYFTAAPAHSGFGF